MEALPQPHICELPICQLLQEILRYAGRKLAMLYHDPHDASK